MGRKSNPKARGDGQEAGMRCGIALDEWASDFASGSYVGQAVTSEVLHPLQGVLYKPDVYAWEVAGLTPGGLLGVGAGGMAEMKWHRRETRRQTEKTNISLKPREDWGMSDHRRTPSRSQQRA